LLSVTGLLRMSNYCVFQAYDGQAAAELCQQLPDIDLLVLNSEGTGMDTPALVHTVPPGTSRLLHIGASAIPGMPSDVPTLAESFTVDQLLATVRNLVAGDPVPMEHTATMSVEQTATLCTQT
jgi:response regulator RpfG family c-di-GMP phosphodiesterase